MSKTQPKMKAERYDNVVVIVTSVVWCPKPATLLVCRRVRNYLRQVTFLCPSVCRMCQLENRCKNFGEMYIGDLY
jgi:hypothetical protein